MIAIFFSLMKNNYESLTDISKEGYTVDKAKSNNNSKNESKKEKIVSNVQDLLDFEYIMGFENIPPFKSL